MNLLLGGQSVNGIKNVIFDLGGVIIDVNYHKTVEEFQKLGISDFNNIYGQYKQSEIFDLYEKGVIGADEFRSTLMNMGGVKLQTKDFDRAWNAMILEMPHHNIELLRKLKNHFNTYLLSNTNEIHLDYFFNYVSDKHKVEDFADLFHKAYYSCRMRMRKPDAEIFQFVLDENGLNPSETLFIDDTSLNVDGALKTGIQAYHLKSSERITDIFATYF